MAYIGNGRTLLVLGSNVRDDLTPGYESASSPAPFDKTNFELSQEVPGGYENNIYVFKQTYISEVIVQDTNLISIAEDNLNSKFSITTTNAALSSALSDIKETTKTYADQNHTITISGSTNSSNNGTFKVESLSYDGTSATIVLTGTGAQVDETSGTNNISISHGYSGFWEVLEPEYDYTVGGTGPTINRILTLTKAPQLNDKVYAIHKGDATYNLVPSDNSVGPEQLSQNLRNFACDKFTGDNSTDTFPLSQESVSSKAILVTVDGVVKQDVDDYTLNAAGDEIIFTVPPTTSAKIRVLHLGFSTVSRRVTFSPGQISGEIADGSITAPKLATGSVSTAKLINDSVTTVKIANDQVTSPKILLTNNTALRALKSDGTTVYSTVKLNASDQLIIDSPTTAHVSIAGVKKLNISSTGILPETTETLSIGSLTNKFVDAHLSGQLNSQTANVAGNITVGGTVDGVDIATLNSTVSSLQTLVDNLVPIGTMMVWPNAVAPSGNWLICDGSAISRETYASLYSVLGNGNYYGHGNGTTTFNIPDLRRRVAIGKGSTTNLGDNDGVSESSRTLNHTHSVPAHTHGLSNHTHSVPPHFHGMGSGADLNIVSSGTHTTTIDISHGHTVNSGSGNSGTSGTLTTNNSVTNVTFTMSSHQHGGFTEWADPIHTHSMQSSGSHKHQLRQESSGTNAGSAANSLNINQSTVTTYKNDANVYTDGAHTHPIDSASINHRHVINPETVGFTWQEPNAGQGHSHTIPTHTHTVSVDSLGVTNKFDNGGSHTHASSAFSGSIGLVTGGVNGNSNMTSGTPSTNVSDSSSVLTTGTQSSVIPYTTVNYIIRAL